MKAGAGAIVKGGRRPSFGREGVLAVPIFSAVFLGASTGNISQIEEMADGVEQETYGVQSLSHRLG